MRAEHQPQIFPADKVTVAVSSIEDGSMRYPPREPEAARNMKLWLPKHGFDPEQTVGLLITYGDDKSYAEIREINEPHAEQGVLVAEGWIEADALVTKTPDLALLLPTGDCGPTTLYDPEHEVIAMAHLGWHSTVHDLAKRLVEYLEDYHDTDPAQLLVHLGPSIRRESYVFDVLADAGSMNTSGTGRRWHSLPYARQRSEDGKYEIDLIGYNLDLLHEAGVDSAHIEVAEVDTLQNEHYFSHFARHHRDKTHRSTGRFVTAIAMKRP